MQRKQRNTALKCTHVDMGQTSTNSEVTSVREGRYVSVRTLRVLDLFVFNLFTIFIYFIFFGCVGFSLLHTGFLQLQRVGATLLCSAWASHCSSFSCFGAQALGVRASVVVARRLSSCGSQDLEHRLSSCGTQAQLLRDMWDLPGPGLEPTSPALTGGFLTTVPPGKP